MTSIVIPDGPKGRSGIHPSARAINCEMDQMGPGLSLRSAGMTIAFAARDRCSPFSPSASCN